MRNKIQSFSVLASIFLTSSVQATESDTPKFVARSDHQTAEVFLREGGKKVEVHLINREKLDLPNSIEVLFRGKDGEKKINLELSTISPTQKDGVQYFGRAPVNPESYIGVEVTIPLKSPKKKILRLFSK